MSSFGYSGTIALAVLRFLPSEGTPCTSTTAAHRRGLFPWQDRPHPFVQRPLPSAEDGQGAFGASCSGALHALVADHVVQGRGIFPGAAYLELARAAARAAFPSAAGAVLQGVAFLQPLAFEMDGSQIECTLSTTHFAVRSGQDGRSAGRHVDAATHCSGSLALGAPGEWQHNTDHAALLGSVCHHPADVAALYDGFDSVGLQYGPGYRTLVQALHGRSGVAVARLHLRGTRQGVQVHPADLDDALCITALAVSSRDDSATGVSSGAPETRVPFAVDDARLQGALGELWAVRCRPPRT